MRQLPITPDLPTARVAPLKSRRDGELLVHEIYRSLQGEGTRTGSPCVFVRTTACHLRCVWCDTSHAFDGGQSMSVDDVVSRVRAHKTRLVLLTGGEPLLQPEVHDVMRALLDQGHEVLLETSGGVSTKGVDSRVVTILDVKCPSSGEVERNIWDNIERLRPHDELKFVIADQQDFDFAKGVLRDQEIKEGVTVLFSPVADVLAPDVLARWILDDGLDVRLQIQLHRLLWGEARGV